jgi:hypothetical protein
MKMKKCSAISGTSVLVEKRTLVVRLASLLNRTGELFPEAELMYVTMFPRQVVRYCDKDGHMTEADVRGFRHCEARGGQGCEGDDDGQWEEDEVCGMWDLRGLGSNMTVTGVRKMGGDRRGWNGFFSALCLRMQETVNEMKE